MDKHATQIGVVALILMGAAVLDGRVLFAQGATDPVIGSWTLDLAKSMFVGNVPDRRIITFEVVKGGAIREIADTRQANGGTDEVEYTAKEDGKDYPISNSVLDTVSLKRVDSRTVERTGKVRGRVVETRTRVLSPDSQVLTVTTKGTNNGLPYQSVQVFNRTSPATTTTNKRSAR